MQILIQYVCDEGHKSACLANDANTTVSGMTLQAAEIHSMSCRKSNAS